LTGPATENTTPLVYYCGHCVTYHFHVLLKLP